MLNEKDVFTWQEHYKDLMREAERDRIAHQALAHKPHIHLHQRALAWLGSYFIAWGCNLQRRYAFGALAGEGTASFDSASAPDCGCVS
jgi:hypothetical protein